MKRKVIVPVGPSIAYVELTQDKWALIDSWNAVRVGDFDWIAHWSPCGAHYYAYRSVNIDGKKTMQHLHRFIAGYREGLTVDHRTPGNGLDCRESNLRHATKELQAWNTRVRKNNTSGYKGVAWDRARGLWRAQIMTNRKAQMICRTPCLAKAVLARGLAVMFYHREEANCEP